MQMVDENNHISDAIKSIKYYIELIIMRNSFFFMIEKSNNFLMAFPRIEIFRFVIKIEISPNCTFKR